MEVEQMEVIVNPRERLFKFFLALPTNIRMVMIDEMEPAERCRFVRCSKLCGNEAKASKNYIFGLRIYGNPRYEIEIHVEFADFQDADTGPRYFIKFAERNRINCMSYEDQHSQELWTQNLDRSVDLVQYAGEYFKNLLNMYSNQIKFVAFVGQDFKNYDFKIESMNKLEGLEIDGDWDLQHYFSKIPHPLKSFYSNNYGDNESMASCEQLYQVQNKVVLNDVALNYEQFLRLAAYSIRMRGIELNERDVFKLIRSWQDGTSRHKNVRYSLNMLYKRKKFHVRTLVERLRMKFVDRETSYYEIKHFHEAGKSARLKYACIYRDVIFDSINPDRIEDEEDPGEDDEEDTDEEDEENEEDEEDEEDVEDEEDEEDEEEEEGGDDEEMR